MLPLAEVQTRVRDALVAGEATGVLPLLTGGRDPRRRLAVHQRHYLASLVSALETKFPATAWLIGAAGVADAARAFVRRHPPAAPSIAEFGATFPDFIAAAPGAAEAPYLRNFATLEWHLGHAAVAVEHAALAMRSLSVYAQDALPDLTLRLQPGVSYLAADWPVDDLIRLYLDGSAPDWLQSLPLWVTQFLGRIAVGGVFLKSGMLKLNSWEFAIKLFEDEYKVPLIDPTVAAFLATFNEIVFSILLFLGLATRLATLPLLGMVFVIQVFVYPQAWTEHLLWTTILLLLLTHGPGRLSLDHWIEQRLAAQR